MDDIYTLLNINRSLIQNFSLKANNVIDHQTELAVNRNVRSLKEVEERMMSDKIIKISPHSIDKIIQKVVDNALINNLDMSIWSVRELRIISYYLMKLQGNEEAYMYALKLLDKNWHNLFFNGLSYYCLNTWYLIDPKLRIRTCELLRNKLLAYNDNNKKYMVMRNHANLFDEAGPLRMSMMIAQKDLDIKDSPTIFNNRPSTISQSFYSDVIINYCDVNKIMDLNLIDSIFDVHNLERTKKLVLADLVHRLNNDGDDIKRAQLCKFANRVLGDVTLGTTWSPFYGATDQDVKKLRQAKDLVNFWFNKKIIETFFEICVQDRFRKEFWLNYIEVMSGFRIVGSASIKRQLQSDSRTSGLFSNLFIETESITSRTSALVFFIKNKMLVEFSDTGALYVYNNGHFMVKKVLKRNSKISNTNELKITSMSNIFDSFNSYKEEGRMPHVGDWQGRLQKWMQNVALSASNTSIPSFDQEDEETFKPRPIIKQVIKPSIKLNNSVIADKGIGALKNKQQENLLQDLSESEVGYDEKLRENTELNPIVYEEHVPYSLCSKWVFDDKCRVVLGPQGFYLNIENELKFVKICDPAEISRLGSIWIKGANTEGWREIVHVRYFKKNTIGFINEFNGNILFKRELGESEPMIIKMK